MGQFCSTSSTSSKSKDNALIDPSSALLDTSQGGVASLISSSGDHHAADAPSGEKSDPYSDEISILKQREAQEAERALREKQRLDAIVSNASHSMLAVHRRNGYYYDPEAAIMAGNLLHSNSAIKQFTCQFKTLICHLPTRSSFATGLISSDKADSEDEDDIIAVLSKEMPWDQQQCMSNASSAIATDISGGSAAADQQDSILSSTMPNSVCEWSWLLGTASGENVTMYLDDCAESFLANMLPPSKEQFGAGLYPIVENLP